MLNANLGLLFNPSSEIQVSPFHDVENERKIRRSSSKVTSLCEVKRVSLKFVENGDRMELQGVPIFLINAFATIFKNSDGFRTVGLFRKEGNKTRLDTVPVSVLVGNSTIPEDLSVHDLCSLVKRFLRDLSNPVLNDPFLIIQLKEMTERATRQKIENFEFSLVMHVHQESNQSQAKSRSSENGTFGFMIVMLSRVSAQSGFNNMTTQNLAICFAPTLMYVAAKKPGKKLSSGKGSISSSAVKYSGDIQVNNAILIELLTRKTAVGYVIEKVVRGVPSPGRASRSHSVVIGSGREPSSSAAENLHRAAMKRRNRSPGPVGLHSLLGFGGLFNRSVSTERGAGFLKNMKNITDATKRTGKSIVVPCEPLYQPLLRRQSTPNTQTFAEAALEVKSYNSPRRTSDVPSLGSHNSRRQSYENANSNQYEAPSARRHSEDKPVSLLGEEAFRSPLARGDKVLPKRRHTAPVKSPLLRRNQPNTLRTGLHPPRRHRSIDRFCTDDDKENDCEYGYDDDTLIIEEETLIKTPTNKGAMLEFDNVPMASPGTFLDFENVDLKPTGISCHKETPSSGKYSLLEIRDNEHRQRRELMLRKREERLTPRHVVAASELATSHGDVPASSSKASTPEPVKYAPSNDDLFCQTALEPEVDDNNHVFFETGCSPMDIDEGDGEINSNHCVPPPPIPITSPPHNSPLPKVESAPQQLTVYEFLMEGFKEFTVNDTKPKERSILEESLPGPSRTSTPHKPPAPSKSATNMRPIPAVPQPQKAQSTTTFAVPTMPPKIRRRNAKSDETTIAVYRKATVLEDDFLGSESVRAQIKNAQDSSSFCPIGPNRPSVFDLRRNREGLVKQRVNQFEITAENEAASARRSSSGRSTLTSPVPLPAPLLPGQPKKEKAVRRLTSECRVPQVSPPLRELAHNL